MNLRLKIQWNRLKSFLSYVGLRNGLNEHVCVENDLWFSCIVIAVLLLTKGLHYDEMFRKFYRRWKIELKVKFVLMFIFHFDMLLSGMVHLLGGSVYLNCSNVKLLVYCEWGYEGCYMK